MKESFSEFGNSDKKIITVGKSDFNLLKQKSKASLIIGLILNV